MPPKEQSSYMLSPAGAQVLFPFRVEVNEKTYDLQVPGKALNVFSNEFRRSNPAYSPKEDDIRWTRRCFHRARVLYTTPRKLGMRR